MRVRERSAKTEEIQESQEMNDEEKSFLDAAGDAVGDIADKAKDKAGEAVDDLKGKAAEVAAGSEDVTEDLTEAARQAVEGIEKPE